MKTIEILSNGKHVQFTTKSVTIEGREYLYSHISELRHSEAKHVYGFKCDGEVIMLPYEEKDEQVLKVIFSQVRQMHRKAASPKAGKAEVPEAQETVTPVSEAQPAIAEEAAAEVPNVAAPAAEISEGVAPVSGADAAEIPAATEGLESAQSEDGSETAGLPEVTETPAASEPPEELPKEVPAPEKTESAVLVDTLPEAPATENTEATATEETADAGSDAASATDAPAEAEGDNTPAEAPALTAKERKRLEKEQRKADKEAAKREKQAQKNGSVTYAESESVPQDPAQKSARFRKAIIVFVIILAVFALLAIAYYFLIGPASDPQIGPNTTDTPQYNDIDDMINDLEN